MLGKLAARIQERKTERKEEHLSIQERIALRKQAELKQKQALAPKPIVAQPHPKPAPVIVPFAALAKPAPAPAAAPPQTRRESRVAARDDRREERDAAQGARIDARHAVREERRDERQEARHEHTNAVQQQRIDARLERHDVRAERRQERPGFENRLERQQERVLDRAEDSLGGPIQDVGQEAIDGQLSGLSDSAKDAYYAVMVELNGWLSEFCVKQITHDRGIKLNAKSAANREAENAMQTYREATAEERAANLEDPDSATARFEALKEEAQLNSYSTERRVERNLASTTREMAAESAVVDIVAEYARKGARFVIEAAPRGQEEAMSAALMYFKNIKAVVQKDRRFLNGSDLMNSAREETTALSQDKDVQHQVVEDTLEGGFPAVFKKIVGKADIENTLAKDVGDFMSLDVKLKIPIWPAPQVNILFGLDGKIERRPQNAQGVKPIKVAIKLGAGMGVSTPDGLPAQASAAAMLGGYFEAEGSTVGDCFLNIGYGIYRLLEVLIPLKNVCGVVQGLMFGLRGKSGLSKQEEAAAWAAMVEEKMVEQGGSVEVGAYTSLEGKVGAKANLGKRGKAHAEASANYMGQYGLGFGGVHGFKRDEDGRLDGGLRIRQELGISAEAGVDIGKFSARIKGSAKVLFDKIGEDKMKFAKFMYDAGLGFKVPSFNRASKDKTGFKNELKSNVGTHQIKEIFKLAGKLFNGAAKETQSKSAGNQEAAELQSGGKDAENTAVDKASIAMDAIAGVLGEIGIQSKDNKSQELMISVNGAYTGNGKWSHKLYFDAYEKLEGTEVFQQMATQAAMKTVTAAAEYGLDELMDIVQELDIQEHIARNINLLSMKMGHLNDVLKHIADTLPQETFGALTDALVELEQPELIAYMNEVQSKLQNAPESDDTDNTTDANTTESLSAYAPASSSAAQAIILDSAKTVGVTMSRVAAKAIFKSGKKTYGSVVGSAVKSTAKSAVSSVKGWFSKDTSTWISGQKPGGTPNTPTIGAQRGQDHVGWTKATTPTEAPKKDAPKIGGHRPSVGLEITKTTNKRLVSIDLVTGQVEIRGAGAVNKA